MLGQTNNPLLQKTEQAIEAKIPPELKNAFDRIVNAGLKVMYDPKSHDMMVKQLSGKGEPADLAGEGAAKLIGILFSQSKGTMPVKAAIPAAIVLLCEGLDFLEQAGRLKVNEQVLSDATQSLGSNLLQLFGATPQRLEELQRGKAGGKPVAPAVPAQPAPARPAGIVSAARGGA